MVEDVDTVLVQDVCGAEMCNHMEECILLFVEECLGREGAGQEVEGWSWGAGVEALESL